MRAPRSVTRLVVLAGIAWAMASCATTPEASVSLEDCPTAGPTAEEASAILGDAQSVVVETNLGTFRIELYSDAAPIATANFVALVRCRFYDEISFHRVIADFVIQAGDPQTRSNRQAFAGLGSGGPGYSFEVEFPDESLAYDQYTVAMANSMQYDPVTGEIQSGTDTNGSQFFIDLDSLVGRLRPYYTILGKVVEGTEVVDAIGSVAVNNPADGVPLEPVIIETMTVASGS